MRVVIIVHRQPELLEVVLTLSSPGGLAGLLDGRQEQADERANDGDHDQEFDERKTMEGSEAEVPLPLCVCGLTPDTACTTIARSGAACFVGIDPHENTLLSCVIAGGWEAPRKILVRWHL